MTTYEKNQKQIKDSIQVLHTPDLKILGLIAEAFKKRHEKTRDLCDKYREQRLKIASQNRQIRSLLASLKAIATLESPDTCWRAEAATGRIRQDIAQKELERQGAITC